MSILKEEHAAKDAVQRSFLQAYANLETFRGKSLFKTWFHRIVVNEAFQLYRSRKPEQILSFSPVEAAYTQFNPVHKKIDEEHMEYYIHQIMTRMKSNESLVLKLFYLEEHTIEEITGITNWSHSKVKVTLHRARNSMKELLTDMYNLNPEELYP